MTIFREMWVTAAASACLTGRVALAGPLPSEAVVHPALVAQADDRRLKQDPEQQKALADRVMAMALDTVLGFVRLDNGMDWPFPCPACGGKLDYRFAHPESLTCAGCGAVVDERDQPPTGSLTGTRPDGREIVFRYHGRGRGRAFTGALMRNRRHARLAEAARALGRQYVRTGDEACATRAVRILIRFADVFPEWPVIHIEAFPRPARFFINPPRPYDDWVHYKWRHTHNYDVPYDLTFAYDFVYNAAAWNALPGAREHVENDLLRAGYRQAWTTHEDVGEQANNLTGTLLASTILLGRTLGDPDMVHRAVFTLEQMLRVFFHFDGMEYEGALTYHGTVTGRCGIAERMLRGYRDPPGYTDERYGIDLSDLNLTRKIPVFARAWKVWQTMRLPNGNPVCVHDTNFGKERRPPTADEPVPNIALNAYGHFAIGRGRGLTGVQAHLHFCPFSRMSHYHQDKLSLILFGAGEEVLSDIGYIHVRGKNRYFANSSLSHNTVTVEYAEPPPRPKLAAAEPEVRGTIERPRRAAAVNRPVQDARSTLIAYDPGTTCDKRVQLVAASVPGNAGSKLQHRTRELLLIALDRDRSCLVDIFRIRGGLRHNFVLRPSCDEDVATEDCSLDFGPERPGTLAGEDLDYDEIPAERDGVLPYSWLVHKLRTAPAVQDWRLTWTGEASGARLHAFLGGLDKAEAWLGQSPSLRQARNNSKRADDFQNPHLLLRRPEGGGGAAFAAVYECVPKGERSVIESVSFRRPDGDGADAPVLIEIRTEHAVVAVQASCVLTSGCERMRPSYDVAASVAGRTLWTWRWPTAVGAADGSGMAERRLSLRAVRRIAEGTEADGFLVQGVVRPGDLVPGQWLRLVFGDGNAYGYEVAAVRPQEGNTFVETAGDPGVAVTPNGVELRYFPFYTTPGPAWIELRRAAFQTAGGVRGGPGRE